MVSLPASASHARRHGLNRNPRTGRRADTLAAISLSVLLGSCSSATEVSESDFSLATGAYPDTVVLCASHTASHCGPANNLLVPIVVKRTNYDEDVKLSLTPAATSAWYLVIDVQPMIPGPSNHRYEPAGWDGAGYVPDHANMSVDALTFGAAYPDSIFGPKTFEIRGEGADGKVRTTIVTFHLTP